MVAYSNDFCYTFIVRGGVSPVLPNTCGVRARFCPRRGNSSKAVTRTRAPRIWGLEFARAKSSYLVCGFFIPRDKRPEVWYGGSVIQYCFNGVPYFILGDPQLGILFTDFRDMCRVENSWGCIENGIVWREGEPVKNELEGMEPKGTWNGSIHKCCGSKSRGWHLGSCENAKTNKKHDPLEQRFFLIMGKYPVNER